MRHFYFATLLSSFFAVHAARNEDSENRLKTELLHQTPRCDQVAENAARLILSGENDDEVMAEWGSICPQSMQLVVYKLAQKLAKIDSTTKELTPELWTHLRSTGRDRRARKKNPEYFRLLNETAREQKTFNEDGKALQAYCIGGYDAFRSAVNEASDGRFKELLRAEREAAQDGFSMSMALSGGAWLPTGNLAQLGNHPSMGIQFLVGFGRFSTGFLFDFRFVNTPAAYSYFDPNTQTIRQTTTFFSFFVGPDFRWEAFRSARFSLFMLASLGYDMISHYVTQRYSGKLPAYSDSFNVNGGLALRYYFSEEKTLYLDFEIRYHRARYSNGGKGGDDLTGDYMTSAVALGYRLTFF